MFTTDTIEWVNSEPILIQNACTFRKGGWFPKFREWLWWKWSDRYFHPTRKIHCATIQHEKISKLVSEAMNRLGLRPSDIEYIVVGPKQAFDFEDQILQTTMNFATQVRIGYSREVYGIKVRIIRGFDGILILPRERNK
ncbi:hypothetical protein LCGC14_2179650 [marine sediment metagenome]|uniref:Uncharacterized protein n=1 Tax=marine sediment metagenome TaxID=412755 RepID=A0A0F9GIJ2_9ZZZZ